MRTALAALVSLGLLIGITASAPSQETTKSKDGTRTVTGIVKSATANGFVVTGKEQNKERDWAFSVDHKTSVRRGSQAGSVTDLKAGDKVTVNYADRDGKVVTQTVTVSDGARPQR